MKGKKFIAILAVLSVFLLAGNAYIYLQADRTGPLIQFPDETVTYKEGRDISVLLDGVTATDDQDGDVTDSLVIEDVFFDSTNSEAYVIYAAKDSHNNVTKTRRTISYVSMDDSAEQETDEQSNEQFIEP